MCTKEKTKAYLLKLKKWAINAFINALKTFGQTAGALLTVGQAIYTFDWGEILAIAATASVASLLTSLANLPLAFKEKGE